MVCDLLHLRCMIAPKYQYGLSYLGSGYSGQNIQGSRSGSECSEAYMLGSGSESLPDLKICYIPTLFDIGDIRYSIAALHYPTQPTTK